MKKIIIMFAMLFSITAIANDIYVEQSGDGSTVDILQDGTGNTIGDSITPAYIGGGANTVNIQQIGSSNSLEAVVNGAATDTTVTTNGSNNVQSITCGTAQSGSCSGSVITQTVTGDTNTITQALGAGANHTSNINVTGDANTVTHTSTATGTTSANITVSGSTNTIGVTQAGMTTQSVTVDSTGNSNAITINQHN
jgi:hypothetical protein